MDNKKFINICKKLVFNYYKENTCELELTADQIWVVWVCKTLQNNKALLTSSVSDGLYFEITYNGDTDEIYFDAYKKVENKRVHIKACERIK